MIKEINVENVFDQEVQPDNSALITLDGYQGCEFQCPYCFQMNNKEWHKNILVRINIVELLQKELAKAPDIKEIFIGSQSDPYMPLEEKYKLTRGILEVLQDKDYKVYITTKVINKLILRDKEILMNFKNPVTIVMGLSHIDEAHKGANHTNIAVANELKKCGIHVDVHITPILPYIMNVDEMIQATNHDINVYLDKLRVFTEGNQHKKIYEWIKKKYPQYEAEYYKILFEKDESYYKNIVCKYKENTRINFLFE